MKSQNTQILEYLKRGRTLSALGALDRFGTMRLAARVKDLRDDGHAIKTVMGRLGRSKLFAVYRL